MTASCSCSRGESLHLSGRAGARAGLQATQLELELQAEVDKFALLAFSPGPVSLERRALHEQLYEHVTFLHSPDYRARRALSTRERSLLARFTSRLLDAESGRGARAPAALLSRWAGRQDQARARGLAFFVVVRFRVVVFFRAGALGAPGPRLLAFPGRIGRWLLFAFRAAIDFTQARGARR